MKLFGKKEEKSCCGGGCTPEAMQNAEQAKKEEGIKILGSGCAKCKSLEEATFKAISELHLDLCIEHVTDFSQIASYGIMTTPALVINGTVVSYGRVLSSDEVIDLLRKHISNL